MRLFGQKAVIGQSFHMGNELIGTSVRFQGRDGLKREASKIALSLAENYGCSYVMLGETHLNY